MIRTRLTAIVLILALASLASAADKPIKLLFLGDRGHHRPADRAAQLIPVMAARGIEITYTGDVNELNDSRLKEFDGLILYANIDEISASQARALLDYVAAGKGFIPLHCASYCFRNNDDVVALIGAQFQRHGTGVFRVAPTEAATDHPVMKGYQGFESWDETYVHSKHNNKDRTVLEFRTEGDRREPWTWVRTHGKGRVFYTAWGHDERTWSNPGFQNLVERGIRWACGTDPGTVVAFADKPEMTVKRKDVKPLEYVEATIPFYPPSRQWGTLAEPVKKMQKPLPAEESIKHFVTPVGFQVELFAAEPDIGKPLAMNWDERGRLWLCETLDYPNELQPPGQGHDRIRICEDTDGDNRADKFTIFAEQLSIPTAITFYRGGAIVQNGTQTLYLKDTSGDDKADVREVLINGWALGDTHGGVSNFHYGFDNWYYAMQGYNNSQPVYDGGNKRSQPFRMGFFRFKVEGGEKDGSPVRVTDVEFLRSTNNNTWGFGFSEEGLIFGSTANGNPSEFLPIPNRYYERVRGWSSSVLNGIADSNKFEPIMENIRQVDQHGGFTAAAGHALYTARAWPQEYWNRTAFVCEPTGHLIATFVIRPDGAGFRSKNSWNILASDDEWSAPIMAEVGPDGQLWVIDWYNIIVQHNPTPAGYRTGKGAAYEINLRDKKHGRIYRVVWKGDSNTPPATAKFPDLSTPSAQVAALKNDNQLWRMHAQRLLIEKRIFTKEVITPLDELSKSSEADAIGMNAPAIHALWTIAGNGSVDDAYVATAAWFEQNLRTALEHKSPAVRRNSFMALNRILPSLTGEFDDPNSRDEFMKSFDQLLAEPNLQVRLAKFLTLADGPKSRSIATSLAKSLTRPENMIDLWLRDGLTAAAANQDQFFLEAVLQQPVKLPAGEATNDLAGEVVQRVANHYARTAPQESLPALIAVLSKSGDHDLVPFLLAGLASGWPKDKPAQMGTEVETELLTLFEKSSAGSRSNLVMLASRWGSKKLASHAAEIAEAFAKTIQDEKADEAARIAAASQLVEFRKDEASVATSLLDLITPRTSPALGQGLLEAIGNSESPEVGGILVSRLAAMTPSLRTTGLRILLARTEWTQALLDALDASTVQLSDLTLDQKQALTNHPSRRLAGRARRLLERGGGLPNPDRQKVLDELMPLTKSPADAVAGKEVFKKQCAKCHMHSGEGTKIGPDLTGMAVHPKHELLIHLIDPSRSVEGNFRVYTVSLSDGRVLTGLLSSESKTAIELVDAEAKRHPLQREDIDDLVVSPKSLMPEGFEKQVPPADIANLLEFLTQRGKFLPIPIDKVATVVSTKGMFNSEEASVERLIFRDWSPKTFEGVPFVLVDPEGTKTPNAIMLNGPHGTLPLRMPRAVTLPCNAPAKAIHLLSGISGWGFPAEPKGTVSLIVRLIYSDGKREDHPLVNGEHFADYIRRVDVPGSKFAYSLRGQQLRYLSVLPERPDVITQIELVKGPDNTVPVVMAVTLESP